jgi:hypothetical protein
VGEVNTLIFMKSRSIRQPLLADFVAKAANRRREVCGRGF